MMLVKKRVRIRRYRIHPSPVCPVHGYPMTVGRTTAAVRYWYCPEHGCKESKKEAAHELYREVDDED